MRRREFIGLIGGAAAWPLAAHAQQARKIVGVLQGVSPTTPPPPLFQVFLKRLSELGWMEGQNLVVEFRGGPNLAELAADFVRMKADVIFAPTTVHVEAARRATMSIPVVFCCHGDPVGLGHVASLAQPGGNLTGLSNPAATLTAKWLQILKEAFPNATLIGGLWEANHPLTMAIMKPFEEDASRIGLRVHTVSVRSEAEFEGALSSMKQAGITAFFAMATPYFFNRRVPLGELALRFGLAGISTATEMAEAGFLFSYGSKLDDLFRRAAEYVDKILRGTKPADLPIEQASKYELAINLNTAKALGLTIPPTLLARADEVIE
jgi:putative ABC transport system substrate-binding protein